MAAKFTCHLLLRNHEFGVACRRLVCRSFLKIIGTPDVDSYFVPVTLIGEPYQQWSSDKCGTSLRLPKP